MGEDEELIASAQKAKRTNKRTNSGNFMEVGLQKQPTLLEEIDEETHLPVETIKPKEVELIKNLF